MFHIRVLEQIGGFDASGSGICQAIVLAADRFIFRVCTGGRAEDFKRGGVLGDNIDRSAPTVKVVLGNKLSGRIVTGSIVTGGNAPLNPGNGL